MLIFLPFLFISMNLWSRYRRDEFGNVRISYALVRLHFSSSVSVTSNHTQNHWSVKLKFSLVLVRPLSVVTVKPILFLCKHTKPHLLLSTKRAILSLIFKGMQT